jgi:hypothetical protein
METWVISYIGKYSLSLIGNTALIFFVASSVIVLPYKMAKSGETYGLSSSPFFLMRLSQSLCRLFIATFTIGSEIYRASAVQ